MEPAPRLHGDKRVGLPPQFENGIVPEDLLANRYGHPIHFWDLRDAANVQTIDLGANHQMALEVRPAHEPDSSNTASSALSSTPRTWKARSGPGTVTGAARFPWRRRRRRSRRAATPPAAASVARVRRRHAAAGDQATIDLRSTARFHVRRLWGTGEMRQYDVTDRGTGLAGLGAHLGGIARHTAHPGGPCGGARR